jgi:hypothetical protein
VALLKPEVPHRARIGERPTNARKPLYVEIKVVWGTLMTDRLMKFCGFRAACFRHQRCATTFKHVRAGGAYCIVLSSWRLARCVAVNGRCVSHPVVGANSSTSFIIKPHTVGYKCGFV